MSISKNELAAAIDVGSNTIRMRISEIKQNGRITPLEDLRKSISLGRDSFSSGIIKPETVRDTCDILNDYIRLMKEYKIKTYRAVSTSAIREAENCEYILEQIKARTGIDVEIINNAQERFYTYKSIRERIDNYQELRKRGVLIVDIGSGGVEASVYSKGYLNFTENVKIGSVRLRELLSELEKKTLNFPDVMEAFVESRIYLLKPRIGELKLKHIIGLGGELKVICALCGHKPGGLVRLYKSELRELHELLKSMSIQNIIEKYKISTDRAESLLPSVIIFGRFLELIDTEFMYAPLVSLRDGLVADIADSKLELKRKTDFEEDILQSARCMGEKYHYDKAHGKQVEMLAMKIFDGTRRLHGLKEEERTYLRLSAILHDIGKFISLNRHPLNSYNIILNSNIIGISNRALNIIANVARYHSEDEPGMNDGSYRALDQKDRMTVSKLSAILKLADSLDISHKQGVKDLDIVFGEEMAVRVRSEDYLTLETWAFQNKSDYFYRVYGEMPIIKRKG